MQSTGLRESYRKEVVEYGKGRDCSPTPTAVAAVEATVEGGRSFFRWSLVDPRELHPFLDAVSIVNGAKDENRQAARGFGQEAFCP